MGEMLLGLLVALLQFSNSFSQSSNLRRTLMEARCKAYCLSECIVPCLKTFDTTDACINNCKNSSICQKSCQFLMSMNNWTDLGKPPNATKILQPSAPAVNTTFTNISTLVLSWQHPSNLSTGVVYLLKRRYEGDRQGGPDFLGMVFTTTTATIKLNEVCSNIDSASRWRWDGIKLFFKVVALTSNSRLAEGRESPEISLPKPDPVVKVAWSTFEYVNRKDADKLDLRVSLVPPTEPSKAIVTGYAVVVPSQNCPSEMLSGRSKYVQGSNNVTVTLDETSKGCNITTQVYSVAQCILSAPATFYIPYKGCRFIESYPWRECIKFDPPPTPDSDRAVRNLRYRPLQPSRDYRFSVNLTWIQPLFNYTFKPFEYTIKYYYETCFLCWTLKDTKERNILIENLLPNKNYTFKVKPEGDTWRGVERGVQVTIPSVPGEETQVKNASARFSPENISNTFQATITWEKPGFRYGTIVGYNVTYTKGNNRPNTVTILKSENAANKTKNTLTIRGFDFNEPLTYKIQVEFHQTWINEGALASSTRHVRATVPPKGEITVQDLQGSLKKNENTDLYTWTAKWKPPRFENQSTFFYKISYKLFGYEEIDCLYSSHHNISECNRPLTTVYLSYEVPNVRPKEQAYIEVTPVFNNSGFLQGISKSIEHEAPAPRDEEVMPCNLTYYENRTLKQVLFSWDPPTFRHSRVRNYDVMYELRDISSKDKSAQLGTRRRRREVISSSYEGIANVTRFSAPEVRPGYELFFQVIPQFHARVIKGKAARRTISRKLPNKNPNVGVWGPGEITGLVVGVLTMFLIAMLLAWIIIMRRKIVDRIKKGQPPSMKHGSMIDRWEVPENKVLIEDELGVGAFGKVCRGYLFELPEHCSGYSSNGKTRSVKSVNQTKGMEVAVKMLHETADIDQRSEFLKEILLMKDVGSHRNIVNMLGCCTLTEPMFLIVEYLPYGDLLHYLRKRRGKVLQYQGTIEREPYHYSAYFQSAFGRAKDQKREQSNELIPETFSSTNAIIESFEESLCSVLVEYQNTNSIVNEAFDMEVLSEEHDDIITSGDLMAFAWQVAQGMEYLSKRGYVHRDLAARNVLVGDNKVAKVADFGLTRHMYEDLYQGKTSRKLPLKWMSVEAIFDQEFTSQSDVWAFGVFLWELVTLGGTPYPTINNKELPKLLGEGYRMEKPDTCSEDIYSMMRKCWEEDPAHRPTFSTLRDYLEELMMQDSPYFDPSCLDESRDYYNVPSFNSASDQDDILDPGKELCKEEELV